MPIRVNDPKSLEDWIVRADQRLRDLEARRIDAADGLTQDHATKQIGVKVSEDAGNAAKIGEDGGVYAENTDTVTTADAHDPLIMQKFMTSATGQSIPTGADTLVVWQGESSSGTGWSTTTSTITIPENGWYGCCVDWGWANNATGNRVMHVTNNNTNVTAGSVFVGTTHPGTGGEAQITLMDFRFFSAGDVLRCYAFQNSGVALNGGSVYFSDIRGRWTVFKVGDAYAPNLTQSTA